MRTSSASLALFLGGVLVCAHGLWGQPGDSRPPECEAAALDVRALPPIAPPVGQYGHIFVLELENIGGKACTLTQPAVELIPQSDRNNNPYFASNREDVPGWHDGDWKVLQAGAWAHVLFAWVTRAPPLLECYQSDGFKMFLGPNSLFSHSDGQAAVEVQHLWVRACHGVYVSGFRMGRYTPESKPSTEWMTWWVPAFMSDKSFAPQITAEQVQIDSPQMRLTADAVRAMLGDPLQLWMRFPWGADDDCALRLVRRRDPSGATAISLEECDATAPVEENAKSKFGESALKGIRADYLQLGPTRPGPVNYEAVVAAREPAGRLFGTAKVDFVVRDPTPPAQAVIVNPLAACTASQLRVESLEPEIVGRRVKLRAYQASNVSDHACSVAGVPKLRFIDERGLDVMMLPSPCPNCDNEAYKARPNGRIDLQPGAAAHFLVAATARESQGDERMRCWRAESVELTASPGDKAVKLPLEAAVCVALDVSAWREGAYDHDPLDARWDKTYGTVLADPQTALPEDCNKPELLKLGRPAMIPSKAGLAYGLSIAQHRFVKGEKVPLHLWVDNPTDAEAGVFTCMHLDYFKAHGFDLYDAYGHRVLRKREVTLREQCAKFPGISQMWSCTRNFAIPIPAHTCVNGDNYDFTAQLADDYDLPPGEYTVHAADATEDICNLPTEAPFKATPGKDLTFEVVQP